VWFSGFRTIRDCENTIVDKNRRGANKIVGLTGAGIKIQYKEI